MSERLTGRRLWIAVGTGGVAALLLVGTASAAGLIWTQQGASIPGPTQTANGHFGLSVALSRDGNTTLVGASSANGYAGSGLIFTRSVAVAPGAPAGVSATAGNRRATVSWRAPVSTGGSAITGYTATANPGGAHCVTTMATSCTIAGLVNGRGYRFTVTARAAAGISAASAPSPTVTPRGVLSVHWSLSNGSLVALVVPYTGAHRYIIVATRTQAKAKSAVCRLTGKGKAQRARCTLTLAPGTWILTAEAQYSATSVIAEATHAVVSTTSVQLGIDVLWYFNGESQAALVKSANTTFSYIKGLGANSVAIVFPFYMSGLRANAVVAKRTTPTPGDLQAAIAVAKRFGLRVSLRPLLDEASFKTPGSWRGAIQPTNRNAWFASYAAFLRPYLIMAQRNRLSQFDVGTELASLGGDPRWNTLVKRARTLFHGQLRYDNNFTSKLFTRGTPEVGSVNVQGIDAYFPVPLGANASVKQLTAAWNNWFRHVSPRVKPQNLVATEVGIPALAGAYASPWSWGSTKPQPIDAAIQQNWFSAACQSVKDLHMGGIYFYPIDFNQPPQSVNPKTAAPNIIIGRGTTAIASCFKNW